MYTPCLNSRQGWLRGWLLHWFPICTVVDCEVQYTQPQKNKEKQTKTARKTTTISTLLMSSHSMHNAVALLLCQLPLAIPICWNVQREHMMKIHVAKHIKYHILNLNTANTPTKRHEWPHMNYPTSWIISHRKKNICYSDCLNHLLCCNDAHKFCYHHHKSSPPLVSSKRFFQVPDNTPAFSWNSITSVKSFRQLLWQVCLGCFQVPLVVEPLWIVKL